MMQPLISFVYVDSMSNESSHSNIMASITCRHIFNMVLFEPTLAGLWGTCLLVLGSFIRQLFAFSLTCDIS